MTREDHTAPLASLSLTHVFYDPTDHISYLCAYLALVPQALVIVYVALLICCRELEIGLMLAGQLACEAANFALKRLIKEERPRGQMTLGKGYGMPSSHAQFVAFWAVYLALFMMIRHTPRPSAGGSRRGSSSSSNSGSIIKTNGVSAATVTATTATIMTNSTTVAWGSFLERFSISLLGLIIALAVAWSRIYLGYHTPRQVLAGWCAGVVCAACWFAITTAARQAGILERTLELPIVRLFRIRDLCLTEDPAQAGWDKWEALRAEKFSRKEL